NLWLARRESRQPQTKCPLAHRKNRNQRGAIDISVGKTATRKTSYLELRRLGTDLFVGRRLFQVDGLSTLQASGYGITRTKILWIVFLSKRTSGTLLPILQN